MPIFPWKAISTPENEREYLIQATYLPLRSYWSILKFFRLTRAVQMQLDNDSPGLVGYTLNAKIMSHKFWTLSAWDDQKSLTDFVVKMPHLKAMRDLRNDMGKTKFVKWTAQGSSLPPSWDAAFAKLGPQ